MGSIHHWLADISLLRHIFHLRYVAQSSFPQASYIYETFAFKIFYLTRIFARASDASYFSIDVSHVIRDSSCDILTDVEISTIALALPLHYVIVTGNDESTDIAFEPLTILLTSAAINSAFN